MAAAKKSTNIRLKYARLNLDCEVGRLRMRSTEYGGEEEDQQQSRPGYEAQDAQSDQGGLHGGFLVRQ